MKIKILFLLILTIYPIRLMETNLNNQLTNLIFVQKGGLPIILTAPHGGQLEIPDVPERKKGTKVKDIYTLDLTLATSKFLFELTGVYPYVVAANFSRKYIDANRSAKRAYEDERAKLVYDSYHQYIAEFIKEIKEKYEKFHLLLDIHGQSLHHDTIFRGTKDKTTIQNLIEKYGENGISGENSIIGILNSKGYKTHLTEITEEEHRSFDGGYTVGKYGSHNKDGIDAIQLEFGRNYREPENIDKTAQNLANAIFQFYKLATKTNFYLGSSCIFSELPR